MDIIKKICLYGSIMGVGTVIGMVLGIRLEERYVITPLNSWNTILIDKLSKYESGGFKIVEDEENEE